MNKIKVLTCLSLLAAMVCQGQQVTGYKSLDAGNPIVFRGSYIVYHGDTVRLSPKSFFIDGQFTDGEAAKYPYVFNCDIRLFTRGVQYFVKGGGQAAVVDTRFNSETVPDIGWRDVITGDMRNYQHNVSFNGEKVLISEKNPVSTSCYRPSCKIMIEIKGNKIFAHADSPVEYYKAPGRPEVVTEVNMEADIIPNAYGGFGIEYNGGASSMIREMKVEWK
jgi:hypothetical protein